MIDLRARTSLLEGNMISTAAATVIRTTDWSRTFDGLEFRVAVMEVCPNCRVMEAHAAEYKGRPDLNRCQVCVKIVSLPGEPTEAEAAVAALEPELVTSYAAHSAHTRDACQSKPRCSAARTCDEGMKLYEAMKRDEAARRTPYVATSQWGRKTGCWTLKHATAHASVQRGEVIDQTHLFRIS